MRKLIILLIMAIFLIGCNNQPDRQELLLNKYKAAYNDLVTNDKFETSSTFYDLDVVVNKIANKQYRVDIIIDNPKVAMYNIEVIAELDSIGLEQYEEVIPSLGIVDQSVYHLIPFQVNKEEGFYAGLVLSGLTEQAAGDGILKIKWTNYAETKTYEEFLSFKYDIHPVNEELEETQDKEEDLDNEEIDSDNE